MEMTVNGIVQCQRLGCTRVHKRKALGGATSFTATSTGSWQRLRPARFFKEARAVFVLAWTLPQTQNTTNRRYKWRPTDGESLWNKAPAPCGTCGHAVFSRRYGFFLCVCTQLITPEPTTSQTRDTADGQLMTTARESKHRHLAAPKTVENHTCYS